MKRAALVVAILLAGCSKPVQKIEHATVVDCQLYGAELTIQEADGYVRTLNLFGSPVPSCEVWKAAPTWTIYVRQDESLGNTIYRFVGAKPAPTGGKK